MQNYGLSIEHPIYFNSLSTSSALPLVQGEENKIKALPAVHSGTDASPSECLAGREHTTVSSGMLLMVIVQQELQVIRLRGTVTGRE